MQYYHITLNCDWEGGKETKYTYSQQRKKLQRKGFYTGYMVYNKMIQDLDVNIHILNLKLQFTLDQRPNYYSSTMVPYFRVTARLSSPQTAHARYLRITKRARPPIFILLEPRREPRYKPFYFLANFLFRGYPGGPEIKTPSFHCWEYRFRPWLGN